MNLPTMIFGQDELKQFDSAMTNEWLITNGLGGYASSTILGLNNRKYHGLLVASLRPPGERTIILSKLDEDIELDGKIFQLGTNDFQHDLYPQGFRFLKEFSLSPFPTFVYSVNDFVLKKSIFLPYDKNASIALYEFVNQSTKDSSIRVFPLISFRRFHYTISDQFQLRQNQNDKDLELAFDNPQAAVILRSAQGKFYPRPIWIEGLFYREEAKRGESSIDKGYQPGFFEFQVPKNSSLKFTIATVVNDSLEEARKTLDSFGLNTTNTEELLANELDRHVTALDSFYKSHEQAKVHAGLNWLLQAASDFVVKGTRNGRFIIAGYQWFGSWGRDTFVSLPGLMLVTGRFEDAQSVILDYTRYCKQGLIPNLIDDNTGEPLYNTVDGTLWYINSILQYIKYTGNLNFIAKLLWPTLKDIIENYRQGTMNAIQIDGDGLLTHGPQLTWMDAVVDGLPCTPRSGKAVEVQALWYNALRTMNLLASRYGEKNAADEYSNMAELARESFNREFWNTESNSLFDVINESGNADSSIRPNQIIVGALDFPIIDKSKANLVVDFVQAELLTPVGLRTLSPKDSRYRGKYEGDRTSRDKSYHNGSIWPWLTGPLTTSFLKAKGYSESNLKYAMNNFIGPLFSSELNRGGLGTINEIYDGDPPFLPRGCISQAWSVAEPLRSYIEDVLQLRPRYEREITLNAEQIIL